MKASGRPSEGYTSAKVLTTPQRILVAQVIQSVSSGRAVAQGRRFGLQPPELTFPAAPFSRLRALDAQLRRLLLPLRLAVEHCFRPSSTRLGECRVVLAAARGVHSGFTSKNVAGVEEWRQHRGKGLKT